MRPRRITPENTVLVMVCFEGPDQYSMAGGLGVRAEHLSRTLANLGFVTHLFFVGDPHVQGEEARCEGRLILHRWCQWISKYYPHGVYEGENGKLHDFNESLPPFIVERVVMPAVAEGKLVVILGEEWQTAEALCRLSDILHAKALRDSVVIFWNANNTFSFDRIDWPRLDFCTTITTVSRYMKHIMWELKLNPLVIPNGIPRDLLRRVDTAEARRVREATDSDVVLCKVARWDPAKRWDTAIGATTKLNEMGIRTVLVARGGVEPYGYEILERARQLGLRVTRATAGSGPSCDYPSLLHSGGTAELIDIRSPLPPSFLSVLYCAADGVLSNSGHEPFGLVGLEAMAAGGVAFTGCTGEDYAIPFINCFVLDTPDPMEIVHYVTYLREFPDESQRIRRAARRTSHYYTWEATARNLVSKLENQAKVQGLLLGKATPHPFPRFESGEQARRRSGYARRSDWSQRRLDLETVASTSKERG